ncbi:MAG: trigger factor [Desulfotomaculales bacterium]
MRATAERIQNNTVVLEVEVEPERFDRAVARAYRQLVRKVTIPGFRPGKAPRFILERYVGREALYSEAIEMLVPEAYREAVEQTGIEPIAQPQVEVIQAEEGKPVVFKATVEVKPEVELGQYLGLEVTRPSTAVAPEQVDEELEKLRERYAPLVTLDEGEVAAGDLVTVTVETYRDGEPVAGGQVADLRVEVGSGRTVFEGDLVGMALGETREITKKLPEDYRVAELAGREVTFRVTVKEIRRKEEVPLDDEFAKDVSEFDTLEELKVHILNRLRERAEERADQEVRQAVVAAAADNARVQIPEGMVEAELEALMAEFTLQLRQRGLTVEDYLRVSSLSPEELRARFRPDAYDRVKTVLVLDAIARAEGIIVGEDEIAAEIERLARRRREDPAGLRKKMEESGEMEVLRRNLQREKTVQFLVDRAVVRGADGQAREG